MENKKIRNKVILAAALTGLVAGATLMGTSDVFAGDKTKAEKGDKHKCADGSCGDKKGKRKGHMKGDKEKCADGSCGDKKGKMMGKKKGHDMKCADGSCGNKKEKKK